VRTRKPVVIGAKTNLGLKPYDNLEPRAVDRSPGVYRTLGLLEALDAEDAGDVVAAAYRDIARPPGGIRNEDAIVEFSCRLASEVRRLLSQEKFPVVVGGDCSVLLGCLLGIEGPGRTGLIFIDGHADLLTAHTSATGGAAGMDLALAMGHGPGPLARLRRGAPLIEGSNVVLLGRRDADQTELIRTYQLEDVPLAELRASTPELTADRVLRSSMSAAPHGFWVHLDVDVLDPAVMSAVDSPEEGGLAVEELIELLKPLVRDRRSIGLDVTIYDPALDSDRSCGRRIVTTLTEVMSG
jgi:arginase